MKAGPALDRQIAKTVMGWEPRYSVDDDARDRWVVRNGEGAAALYSLTYHMNQWQPSTNITDAMEVVEKMATLPHPWMLTLKNWNYYGDRTWTAEFITHPLGPTVPEVRAATASLAICLAALQVMEQVSKT